MCDGPPAYICNVWYGKAIFQTGFIGIGVMLKDNQPGLSRAGRDKQDNLAAAFADSFKED